MARAKQPENPRQSLAKDMLTRTSLTSWLEDHGSEELLEQYEADLQSSQLPEEWAGKGKLAEIDAQFTGMMTHTHLLANIAVLAVPHLGDTMRAQSRVEMLEESFIHRLDDAMITLREFARDYFAIAVELAEARERGVEIAGFEHMAEDMQINLASHLQEIRQYLKGSVGELESWAGHDSEDNRVIYQLASKKLPARINAIIGQLEKEIDTLPDHLNAIRGGEDILARRTVFGEVDDVKAGAGVVDLSARRGKGPSRGGDDE